MNEATRGFSRAVRRGSLTGTVQAQCSFTCILAARNASVWFNEEALTNTTVLVLGTDSFVLLNLCTNVVLVLLNLCTHVAVMLLNLCTHIAVMLLNSCKHLPSSYPIHIHT